MQDRYAGDVGDFAKYALLRAMVRETQLRLGVVWCLVEDERHNSDGRHIGYLDRPEFRSLDSELHDRLARIVHSGRRSVRQVMRASIFPANTLYFAVPIMRLSEKTDRSAREAGRAKWLSGALAATAECDLVFLDPDNGLETPSVPRHSRKASKYVFWDELSSFWKRGQSLVVYHHLNRSASVQDQTKALRQRFLNNFGDAPFIRALLFRHGSCRHFWILGQPQHGPKLSSRINAMIKAGWSGYFEIS
jgi:hypothetical protein